MASTKEVLLQDVPDLHEHMWKYLLGQGMSVLSEFKKETAREAWLLCKYGQGFKAIVQSMIARRWAFSDCKMDDMRAFLENHIKGLTIAHSNPQRIKNALEEANATSFRLLIRLSGSDIVSHARNMGPDRVGRLKLAVKEAGFSLLPD